MWAKIYPIERSVKLFKLEKKERCELYETVKETEYFTSLVTHNT